MIGNISLLGNTIQFEDDNEVLWEIICLVLKEKRVEVITTQSLRA